MGLYTEAELRIKSRSRTSFKSARTILNEETASASTKTSFDIFLSHSIKDAEIVFGIKLVLEEQGFSVYVDWIDDPHLDRGAVTADTAERLRVRMKQSRRLAYAHSNNSPSSKWMPWELGYFDGLKGNICVFPVVHAEGDKFEGQEFLGLYPYIDHLSSIYVNRGRAAQRTLGPAAAGKAYLGFKDWMKEYG